MSEIVEMSKKISDLNDKKEFHKKNCELRFQDSVLDNINPQLFTPNLKTIQNPCLSLDPGWFLFS
ncbi:hypothetical protein RLD22_01415, partial [Streptococcus pneumoniae]|nr:hypothetical protein [Streptococcus pneumoniae]